MEQYYTLTRKRPNITLSDIMMDMSDYWRRTKATSPLPVYKAYKTREKRATAEIINTLDLILDERLDLTPKDRAMFKEFSLTVVSAFRGLILDAMHPDK